MKSSDNNDFEEKNPSELHQEYSSFCNLNSSQMLDERGLHHYFNDRESAKEFADWMKKQKALKNTSTVKVLNLENSYDVILSPQQFNIIMGENAFSRLLSEEKINEYAEITHRGVYNRLPFFHRELVKVLSETEIKEEFNQRRFLLKKDKLNRNFLFTLCSKFSDILDSILPIMNKGALDQAFLQSNPSGSILHEINDSNLFFIRPGLSKLLKFISIEALNRGLIKQDKLGRTGLFIISQYSGYETNLFVFDKASPEILAQALIIPDHQNKTIWDKYTHIWNQSIDLAKKIIACFSVEMLSKYILKGNKLNEEVFVMIMRSENTEFVINVIKKFPSRALSKALASSKTVLQSAVTDAKIFWHLIAYVPREALWQQLIKKDETGNTLFHLILLNQSVNEFITLMSLVEQLDVHHAVILDSLLIKNAIDLTFVDILFMKKDVELGLKAIEKALKIFTPPGLFKNEDIQTKTFNCLMRLRQSEMIQQVLKDISSELLTKVLTMSNENGQTILHEMARITHYITKIKMIKEKVSAEILEQAYLKLTNHNESILHYLASFQGEIVADFLDILPKPVFNQICTIKSGGYTIFDYLMYYSYDAVSKLLARVDDEKLRIYLNSEKTTLSNRIVFWMNVTDKNLQRRIVLNDEELIQKIQNACNDWVNSGSVQSGTLIMTDLLHLYFSLFEDKINDKERYVSHSLPRSKSELPDENPSEITLGNSKKITLHEIDKNANTEVIFQHGLKSWDDYRKIRVYLRNEANQPIKHRSNRLQLLFILDTLWREELVLKGASITYDKFLLFPGVQEQLTSFIDIYNCIQHLNGFIKIIKPENFDDFVKQLKDYTYRPKLRDINEDDKKHTHKFVHLENKVVPYQSHKSNKKLKSYLSLKKQSITLLGYQLLTSVFGQSDPSRLLVGMLFDADLCLPSKGFFKKDAGTTSRFWVGSEAAVNSYKVKINSSFFLNMEETQKFVELNPTVMTEILARVTRESAKSIVIARDTPEARIVAESRQEKIKKDVGIELPIIFYNNNCQMISIYSKIPLVKYAKAKEKLMAMPMLFKANHTKFAFVDKNRHLNESIKEAKIAIKELIAEAKNLEEKNPGIWVYHLQVARKILKDIQHQLSDKIPATSILTRKSQI